MTGHAIRIHVARFTKCTFFSFCCDSPFYWHFNEKCSSIIYEHLAWPFKLHRKLFFCSPKWWAVEIQTVCHRHIVTKHLGQIFTDSCLRLGSHVWITVDQTIKSKLKRPILMFQMFTKQQDPLTMLSNVQVNIFICCLQAKDLYSSCQFTKIKHIIQMN